MHNEELDKNQITDICSLYSTRRSNFDLAVLSNTIQTKDRILEILSEEVSKLREDLKNLGTTARLRTSLDQRFKTECFEVTRRLDGAEELSREELTRF